MLKVCCFIGHRTINESDELEDKLYSVVKNLIEKEGVSIFLFGSKSQFDELCLEVVTNMKTIYPHIQRIYVRAEFPHINDDYKNYLLKRYDNTFYPATLFNAGRAVYIKRNEIMIDKSDILVMYYDENYLPKPQNNRENLFTPHRTASGTRHAYNYAKKKNNISLINIAPSQKKDSTN